MSKRRFEQIKRRDMRGPYGKANYGFGNRYEFDDDDDDEEEEDMDEMSKVLEDASKEEELIWKARFELLQKCDEIDELSDEIGDIVNKFGIRYCTSEVYDYCERELR